MRIASWIFIACAGLAAIGLFVPAIEARTAIAAHVGGRLARRTTLTLHEAAADRDLARRLLAVYRASRGQHVGAQLLDAMEPLARGRIKDAVDDAHDAMSALGGISDDNARTIGTAVAAAIWLFLALQIAMAGLVFVQVVGGSYRRGRIVGALVLAIVGAAMAGAIFYGCEQVVLAVNDEIAYSIVELGPGAWMIPIAAVGALGCGIALLRAHVRASRR